MTPQAADGGSGGRPRKMARRVGPENSVAPSPARSTLDMARFVAEQQHSTIAWSCTNLMAFPAPAAPPSPSLLGPPYSTQAGTTQSPSVTFTHLSGTPTAPRPRLSFTVALPPSACNSSAANAFNITHLTFSPCGAYLLVVCSSDNSDTLTVLEQQAGCINQWEPVWCERVTRFTGEGQNGHTTPRIMTDASRLVSSRWLGEPRKWYPTPEGLSDMNAAAAARPLYCAPQRSPPIGGAAFIAVLSSNELLFVHLPRSSPLVPFALVLPLQPPPSDARLTLTARPTASTLAAQHPGSGMNGVGALNGLTAPSPHNPLDALVANLVDGMPTNGPSPGAVVGALGLGGVPGATSHSGQTTAGEAMKQELKAAEIAKGVAAGNTVNGRRLRVGKAAVGFARAGENSEIGVTTMLVATTSFSTPRPPPAPPSSVVPPAVLAAAANLSLPNFATGIDASDVHASANTKYHSSSLSSPDDFSTDFADFSALDEAFGGGSTSYTAEPTPAAAVKDASDQDGDHEADGRFQAAGEDGERRVELSEVRIEMMCQDGPRLTVRPLGPIHLSDGVNPAGIAAGSLTHLEWLEDVLQSPPGATVGSEAAVDLRLLAVHATDGEEGRQISQLTSWAISNQAYELSDAFAGLDCKKGDAKAGEREWSARWTAFTTLDSLITAVLPRSGSPFDSFAAVTTGQVSSDGSTSSQVQLMRSSTLERLLGSVPITLPGSILHSQAAASPNSSLVSVRSLYSLDSKLRVSLAAFPETDSSSWSTHLARAMAQQVDFSDLLGRVIGLEDDVQTLTIVRDLRDLLQTMLPSGRKLDHSGLLLELLGIVSALFTASSNLQLRGSVARDFLKLAALVRAFKKSEKKERTAGSDLLYRCESDAVWPLIAHATWYCDFARNLARECSAKGSTAASTSTPRHVLLLHPLGRSLLNQAADSFLGLQGFLASFQQNQNFTVDTAKTVLDDVVDYNGLVLTEWKAALNKISEIEGITGDDAALRDLLVTFDPASPHFDKAIESVTSLLSASGLFLPAELPTPPATPQVSSSLTQQNALPDELSLLQAPLNPLDLIRRNRLSEKGLFQRCTRCGERAERRVLLGTEAGKWSAYEIGWEQKCLCGGLWYADDVL